mgnify:CR=1 FL=1
MSKIRVVQYINQFFAQIGGEEKADIPAELREGPVGPGLAFNAAWGDEAEVVATIICGDSYFNENLEKAQAEVLEMVKSQNPDMFIAGPAFNAGRYGVACGTIAKAVQDNLNIPVLTGMYVENWPGRGCCVCWCFCWSSPAARPSGWARHGGIFWAAASSGSM